MGCVGRHGPCCIFLPKCLEICAVALSVAGIPSSFKRDYYEQMEYDLLVRMQRWNAIIKKANEKEPKNSSCSQALGLALCKTGMISTEQFASQIHPKNMGRDRFSASVLGESYSPSGIQRLTSVFLTSRQAAGKLCRL